MSDGPGKDSAPAQGLCCEDVRAQLHMKTFPAGSSPRHHLDHHLFCPPQRMLGGFPRPLVQALLVNDWAE